MRIEIKEIPVIADALERSSNRRTHIVEIFSCIAAYYDCSPVNIDNILEAFGKIHAAASIMDDLLDNEQFRNGEPTYHTRHSIPLAALASIHLTFDAIEDFSNLGVPYKKIMKRVLNMTYAEEADIGILKKPKQTGYLDWYENVSGRKTSHELLLLIDTVLHDLDPKLETEVEKTYSVIDHFGLLLQMTNDWRDFFETDPFYRLGEGEKFVITNSLPFAIYCQFEDPNMFEVLGKAFDKIEAASNLNRYLTTTNKLRCKDVIHNHFHELEVSVKTSGIPSMLPLLKIAEAAVSGEFWRPKVKRYA